MMMEETEAVNPSTKAQRPTMTSYSRGNASSSYQRLTTTASTARPSTAVRAVGYTGESSKSFEKLLNQKMKIHNDAAINNADTKDTEPQIKYKHLENKVSNLLEQSIILSASSPPNYIEALNKAKEASVLDSGLLRMRDQNRETSFHNFDITYSVFFNLAQQYESNDMYVEALNTYSIMTKDEMFKMFPHANQLKLNMGNIYSKMGRYKKAIKLYQMALDSVPIQHKQLRLKITQNIGTIFIKMGQYSDAATNFEIVLGERAEISCAIHLILCYYALGNIEKIKHAFKILVESQLFYEDDIKLRSTENQGHGEDSDENGNKSSKQIFEYLKNDEFARYCNIKKKKAEKSISIIIDLISGVISDNYNDGYIWCIEVIKSSNFAWLANALELNKALVYLRQNDINQAVETLSFYEKKDPEMAVNALTNLMFIYISLNDLENASKCTQKITVDIFEHPTLLKNVIALEMCRGNWDQSRKLLEKAVSMEPDSFELNYNLALVYKHTNEVQLAAAILNNLKNSTALAYTKHPHIFYQLASLCELENANHEALELYLQLLGITNEMDAKLYAKVGEIYERFGEHQEANQYLNEAFRINPSNIQTATTLGSYFIKMQAVEKAIFYYERAVLSNPQDPVIQLRIAGCFRNILMPRQYLELFKKIYEKFPENMQCLKALVYVTKSQGLTELHEKYSAEMSRLEKKLMSRAPTALTDGNGNRSRRLSRTGSATSTTSAASGFAERSQFVSSEYIDPLGPKPERPRTGMASAMRMRNRGDSQNGDMDEDDNINTEELLPM